STAQRLGCFLLRLCGAQEAGAAKLEIPVEKHVLAMYLGMKPETLSRSQQALKAVGVEVAGPMITITQVQKLRSYVCDSCSATGECE
ncbi:MAG: helix-turn-helix domain-containing protein, partial [Rickettsiales bacterium]|nr:helix-turn-helix domain-containing protein [Rickettsiales bacterium]